MKRIHNLSSNKWNDEKWKWDLKHSFSIHVTVDVDCMCNGEINYIKVLCVADIILHFYHTIWTKRKVCKDFCIWHANETNIIF